MPRKRELIDKPKKIRAAVPQSLKDSPIWIPPPPDSLPTLWAVPLRPDCQEGIEGTEKRAKPPDAAGDLRRREGSN